jgi:hypothetical protein
MRGDSPVLAIGFVSRTAAEYLAQSLGVGADAGVTLD